MLATNVAETSLTVPGIRYVVDTGSLGSRATPPAPGSAPADRADQPGLGQPAPRLVRPGGAGYRDPVVPEEDFDGRPEFTDPEILRTNLASVILQMTSLGSATLERFPFVELSDPRNVSAGRSCSRS